MAEFIYGTFDDPWMAERAAGALLDHGVRFEDLSFIASERYNPQAGIQPDEASVHERHVKKGITISTSADATAGAIKGLGLGTILGGVAALASMLIPGYGLVLGGGAFSAALGAMAGTAAAGALAGGVAGWLTDQGVPEHAAQRFHHHVDKGGAIVSLRLPSGHVMRDEATQVLMKYNADDIEMYGAAEVEQPSLAVSETYLVEGGERL